MARTHMQTTRSPHTYRPERPKFTAAEIIAGLVHESARRMMDAQIEDSASLEMRIHEHQKAMLLLAAAERIADMEAEG